MVKKEKDLFGVKGWLKVLMIYLAIYPLPIFYAIIFLGYNPSWVSYLTIALSWGSAYNIYSKEGMARWSSFAFFIWIILLESNSIISCLMYPNEYACLLTSPVGSIIKIGICIAWIIYLLKSKRVKETLFSDTPLVT